MRARRYRHENSVIIIAPRRSGKTRLVIQHAIEYATESTEHYSVVVAHNYHETRRLQEQVRRQLGYDTEKIKFFSITNIGKNSNLWRNIHPNQYVKFFFDEFELMDNRLPVDVGVAEAYYISSPAHRYERSQTQRLIDNWGIDTYTIEEIDFMRHYGNVLDRARRNMFMTDEEIQDLTDEVINSAVREIRNDDAESDDSYLYRIGA